MRKARAEARPQVKTLESLAALLGDRGAAQERVVAAEPETLRAALERFVQPGSRRRRALTAMLEQAPPLQDETRGEAGRIAAVIRGERPQGPDRLQWVHLLRLPEVAWWCTFVRAQERIRGLGDEHESESRTLNRTEP